jgi:hypothetical protein
MQPF